MSRATPNPRTLAAFVEEFAPDAAAPDKAALASFILRLCTLDIRRQFLIQARFIRGLPYQTIADEYRATFGDSLTPSGVAAAIASATPQKDLAPDVPERGSQDPSAGAC